MDEETAIREITRETLLAYGCRTMTASDGADRVALIAEDKSEIVAVITDIVMPIMDGNAAIAALKRINPDIIIIAAGGLTAKGQTSILTDSSPQAFLKKPYTAEKMLRTMSAALN